MSKNIICQFTSLNACSLIKSNNRQTQTEYIRYLRLQNYDILCFQETQARTPELISSLNIHFQPQSSYWTKHVGIVSLSPFFQISNINTSHIFTDDRFQLCSVAHPQKLYEPFYILNLYAPASNHKARQTFFEQILAMLYGIQDQISFDRLIIAGDFNYSLQRPNILKQATSADWLHLLELFFYNSMQLHNLTDIPTFQRSHGDSIVSSVIDYIYVGQHHRHQLQDAQISRLNSAWTDHSLLHISFSVGQAPTGPGLWRANPAYASHLALQQQIEDKVQKTLDRLNTDSVMSPEDKWDQIKIATKKVIRNYSYDYVNWRQKTIKHLERTRNRILRGKPSIALRIQLLGPLDQQLGQLQQELAAIDALKAGTRWRENGEKSAGFLKRIHQQRTIQQHMTAVRRLEHGHANITIDTATPTEQTSDPVEMREIVRQILSATL
jgi:exonuclease III